MQITLSLQPEFMKGISGSFFVKSSRKSGKFIHEVSKLNKPTTVVLIGGSAIKTTDWKDKVGAILDVWYPGEEGGNAVAKVLFGEENPSGKLPITFPVEEGQLPLTYNHHPTGEEMIIMI
jgi:beta-glucosidase